MVLVAPEQAANIGFVARCLACYHIQDLRIVGTSTLAQSEPAFKTAKGAAQILESARYFNSLPEAISDCVYSVGFTRRTREPGQRIHDLPTFVKGWKSQQDSNSLHSNFTANAIGTTALVFGRESQGLNREETMDLSHLIRIPMPHDLLSLNLSHAVAIALYAFAEPQPSMTEPESSTRKSESSLEDLEKRNHALLATHHESHAGLEALLYSLEQKGFYKGGKEAAQKDYIRILWQRLQPTKAELDFLAGMLKRLMVNS